MTALTRPGPHARPAHERLPLLGADATLQNVGPERPALWDPDELEAWAGTTSGARIRGKPKRGSRPGNGW